MSLFSKTNIQNLAIFSILVLLPLSAIWSVEFYVNQDGMPHLYNAYLILEILKGNEAISQFVTLNPVLIPNLTGHWILAFLLSVFSAAAATKIFVSFLFAGLVASVCWLRRQIAGSEDYFTGLLLAVVLAFNWMWFLGFYNFILGAIGFAFTLGLWWKWREKLNYWRSLIIFLLLLFVFLSHLISFCALVFTLFILCLANLRQKSYKPAIWTFFATLLTLPFLFNYLRLSNAGDKFSPSWSFLENPLSISGWLYHLRVADPFQLLSRKSIPFFDLTSPVFGIFSPSLWLIIALFCLSAATFLVWKKQKADENKNLLLWSGLALFFCVVWVFAPDDFGKSHGSFLRERILLLGLICFLPAFRLNNHVTLKRIAQISLIFIIIFQSAVVWDYSMHANRRAKEIIAARDFIGENDSFGSIILNRDGCKFKPIPRSNLTAFMAVGKNTRYWDNYELGYYLFPVIARNDEDRRFISEFREGNTFDFCDANEQFENKFNKLNKVLQTHHDKIKVLLVWGRDEKIDELISNWYEKEPFYQNEDVRLFRLR